MNEELDVMASRLNRSEATIVEYNVESIARAMYSGGWRVNRQRRVYERDLELFFTDTGWLCDPSDPHVIYKCYVKLRDTSDFVVSKVGPVTFIKVSPELPNSGSLVAFIQLSIDLAISECCKFNRFIHRPYSS